MDKVELRDNISGVGDIGLPPAAKVSIAFYTLMVYHLTV